ncbi:MAG: class I SAM-dependent methyltransferase, partial [Actinomycetota bacterium]|nr:class I SAM-dependent methyltransferase [Actinomycetota bacterium]
GHTLELGAGTGLNLPHYSSAVTDLVLTDPSPSMLRPLREALTRAAPPVGRSEVRAADAQSLPFGDDSFDTVVSTFVQCSVHDPAAVLIEIARVLRPGGRYLFLDHVRAPDSRALARTQDILARPHRVIAAGCHPNRDGEALLDASPLVVQNLVRGTQRRAVPTVRPIISGMALAPS